MRFLVLFALLAARSAWGLITIGDNPASLLPPENGAPWQYVAQLGTPAGFGGSAVYLGNGFLLTANHVAPIGPVFLNGTSYEIDGSFAGGGAQRIGALDLKVIKIVGDPLLPALELAAPADADLGQASTIIGWGVGKGAEVPGQGWLWGTGAVERWGSNVTDSALYDGEPADGEILTTHFDLEAGGSEAQLAILDSGSALFQNFGGVWKLAGIGFAVDTDQAALYDMDLETAGNQPDASYYLRVKSVRAEIFAIAGVPEPAAGGALLLGAGILGGRRVRRRGTGGSGYS